MDKTLTITLPEDVYEGLRRRAGGEDIGRFIEGLLRPLVLNDTALDAAYAEMAADTTREQEALEWIEAAPDDALE